MEYTIIEWGIIFLITLGVHEFGHWMAFHLQKHKAKLSFKLPFYMAVGENIQFNPTIKEFKHILIMGIFLGWFYLELYNPSRLLVMSYLLLCSADFTNLIQFFQVSKEDKTLTLKNYYKKQYEKFV